MSSPLSLRSRLHYDTIRRLLVAIFPDRADWTFVNTVRHLGFNHSRSPRDHPSSVRNAVFRALYTDDGDLVTRYLFDEILVSVQVASLREYRGGDEERLFIGSWRCPRFHFSEDEVALFTEEIALALRSILTNLRPPNDTKDDDYNSSGCGSSDAKATVRGGVVVRFSQRYWSHSVNSLVSILELMCTKFTLTFDDRLPCVDPQNMMLSLRVGDHYRPRTLAAWCIVRWNFFVLRRRCCSIDDTSSLRCTRCARYIFVQLRRQLRRLAYRMLANGQIILSSKFIRLYIRTMRQCDALCDACDDGNYRLDVTTATTDIHLDLWYDMIGGAYTAERTEFTRHSDTPCLSRLSPIAHFSREIAHLLPVCGFHRSIDIRANELIVDPLLPVLMFSMFGQEKYKLTISYDCARSITASRRIGERRRILVDHVPI